MNGVVGMPVIIIYVPRVNTAVDQLPKGSVS